MKMACDANAPPQKSTNERSRALKMHVRWACTK
jgi:hypothetical protein